MRVDGRYIKVYGPHLIVFENIYTKALVTNASDQVGWIYISREKLNVRRIGNNAKLELGAVHKGCEADLAADV